MQEPASATNAPLVGRMSQRAALDAAISAAPDGTSTVVVFGPAGIGKSALLDDLADRLAHHTFIRLRGAAARQLVPFGALRDLLAGIAGHAPHTVRSGDDAIDDLRAGRQVDANALRVEIVDLLDHLELDGPLLVVIDDFQDIDPGSRALLLALAQRRSGHAVIMVVGLRTEELPADLSSLAPTTIALTPLTELDSSALVDGLPVPPVGRRRFDVLRCAAGNPLALLELSRADTASPPVPGTGGLSLTHVLEHAYRPRLDKLSEPGRWALLLAACGESRLRVLHGPPLGLSPDDWDEGEELGVISIAAGQVRFRHPLVESAVYYAEPEHRRASAHAALANALVDSPGLVAWHRSACTRSPDESIARELADYGEHVVAQGDSVTAALVLERAADLTTDSTARAHRLFRAAELAGISGQTSWVSELVRPLRTNPDLPEIRALSAGLLGWLEIMDDRPVVAADVLLAASESADTGDLSVQERLLGTAALPVYSAGSPALITRLARALSRLEAGGLDMSDPTLTWASAIARPSDELLSRVRAEDFATDVAGYDAFLRAIDAGACSLVLDDTASSIRHFEPVCALLSSGVGFFPALTSFAALGWAYLDAGRPDAALANAQAALSPGQLLPATVHRNVSAVQTAIASLMLGVFDGTVPAAQRAIQRATDPALTAQLAWALGRYAMSCDDPATAWSQLRTLYDDSGAPTHSFIGVLAIADTCIAGTATGHDQEAATILAKVKHARTWVSLRQQFILARAARALHVDSVEMLDVLLGDHAAQQWPFEYGLSLFELGVALQRSRQPERARDALFAALAHFEQVGAQRWQALARRWLRATGERVAPTTNNPLAALTEQQQRIVVLAARGLSNQEIAEQLTLSARTVGSHLYRSFPKLGITNRAQLPSLLAAVDDHGPAGKPGHRAG